MLMMRSQNEETDKEIGNMTFKRKDNDKERAWIKVEKTLVKNWRSEKRGIG